MRPTLWSALALCAACASQPEPAAVPAPAEPSPHTQLESIFWHCDYVATTKGMDATPVRECAAATRELRQVKFGGNFNRMLEWWRANKPAEHDRIRQLRSE